MGSQFAIAHYQVTAKIGEGGMGEVWRATDTKLGRDVAVKILPEALAGDADRMARFAREAQVLASLNHPNIAAIYGVEERALVMELVEGPTLAARIAEGPLPLEEALPIARQIAEALEYAHEKGVIHRDLKPANIKITPEGRVKVLDFGLAKALATEQAGADSMSSPTLTMRATLAGTIMGTAAYMSPEQAKGKPVDRRADIWAFGIVLVEMLTARLMYSGETVSETLAAVIMKEPDLSGLPDATPVSIRKLLARCLDRDPQSRLRDIGEARIALEKYLAHPASEEAVRDTSLPARTASMWRWIAAGLAIAVAALAALLWRGGPATLRPWMHFSAALGPNAIPGTYITVAISHDGTRIVFPVRTDQGTQLATRLMDQSKAMVLAGTESGEQPFFSPDDEWIGFFADGKMKKIAVSGGAPFIICDAPSARGASWGEKGEIIANIDLFHLSRIPAAGGTPKIVATPNEQRQSPSPASYRYPQVLPGGDSVLISAGTPGLFEDASLGVLSLKTGAVKIVQQGGYYGRYLPSGHLIFIRQGTLYAAPFDLQRLEVRAAPVPVLQEIAANPGPGTAQIDISGAGSGTGTLVYLAGKGGAAQQLAWMDASGKKTPLLTATVPITPRLSPDGKLIAVSSKRDISIYDPQRGASTQITFTAADGNNNPVWTPDGKHLVYASSKGVWWTRADGSTQPVRLLETKTFATPASFTPDGKRLAFYQTGDGTPPDIWVLPLDISDLDHPKPGTPEAVVHSPMPEMDPAFSPDGRWLAYVSAESGDLQVYVRPYPAEGGKWHISTSTGRFPVWSKNGKELFYETLDGRIMVVEYAAGGGTFSAGTPHPWSTTPVFVTGPYQNLDLAPDGKRFLTISGESAVFGDSASLHAVFVVNFFDELKRRLP